jgi:FkbM family methyltransferase
LLTTKPKFIIDAGANVGYASVLFANRYPDAKIIAVEPEEENFNLLKQNTVAYPNVTCMQCGVWSRDTYLKIENPLAQHWAFRVIETDCPKDSFLSVTLTSLLRNANMDRIDLLKIDVEGAELEIFGAVDCANWLDRTDVILIELHGNCEKVFYKAIEKQSFLISQLGENVVLIRQPD